MRPELSNPEKRAKERRRQARRRAEGQLMEIVALARQARKHLRDADVPLQDGGLEDLKQAQSVLGSMFLEDKTRRKFSPYDQGGEDDGVHSDASVRG